MTFKLEVHPYRLPLVGAIQTSVTRCVVRRGWWLRLEDDEGRVGWGDAAPWPGFGSGFRITGDVLGHLERDGAPPMGEGRPPAWLQESPEARFALECAQMDLESQRRGVPLASLLAPEAPLVVPVNGLVDSLEDVRAALDTGVGHLKVKVGALPVAQDVERVRAIVREAGRGVRISLDANGSWTLLDATQAVEGLRDLDISWIEQPLATEALDDTRELRRRTEIPIAIDEGLRTSDDVDRYADSEAIDIAVLKPMFLGGLEAAKRLARRARELDLSFLFTTALESPVGRTATAHLAAAVPSPLGTFGWGGAMEQRRCDAPPVVGGTLSLPLSPGLGLEPKRGSSGVRHPVSVTARLLPDKPAIHGSGTTLTHRQLHERVARAAGSLARQGVRDGQVVCVTGRPSVDWVVQFHGLTWLGAIVAPLNLTADGDADAERVHAIDPDWMLHVGEDHGDSNLPYPSLTSGEADPVAPRPWELDHLRLMLLTSGSTGVSKLVPLGADQLMYSALGATWRLGHQAKDRWLLCLPLHHVGGLSILLRAAWTGAAVEVLPDFDADEVSDRLASGDISLVSLVPTMLRRVLDARGDVPFPSSLRAVLLGGAPAPPGLLDRCRALCIPIRLTWGMTETAAQVATMADGDPLEAGQAGKPHAFAQVHEEAGRLVVSGPIIRGRSLRTADRGWVGDDGRVHITGRADATVNTGGELVDPVQVETTLGHHPSVAEALVFGVPDPDWGERLVAWLVMRTQSDRPDQLELKTWCRGRLERAAIPREFVWVEALPSGSLGKPDRGAARRQHQEDV